MTVESTTRRAQYDTNGTTGPWTVPFYFLANADLEVIHTDAAGVETTLTLTTHYSVTGAGVPSGGSVTTVASYASGGTITVLRSVAILQETDYVETDAFPAAAHETALDRLTMIAQQQGEALDRTLTFPVSDELSGTLPPAATRANRLLAFDATGAPEESPFTVTQVASAVAAAYTGMGTADAAAFLAAGTGATPRTMQDKGRETVSVLDFGATGDGTTNDTAAFTLALNSGASRVLVPGGRTYIVKDSTDTVAADVLVLPAGVTIEGDGPGAVIKLGAHSTIGHRLIKAAADTGAVLNLTLDGNKSQQTGVADEQSHLLFIFGGSNVRAHGVMFKDAMGDGVYIGGTTEPGPVNVEISGCRFDGNVRQGISLVRGAQIRIIGNDIANTTGNAPGAGIDLEANLAATTLKQIVIANNIIRGNYWGIFVHELAPAREVTITGNTFSGNRAADIFCRGTQVTIADNVISVGAKEDTYAAIDLTDCAQVSVTGNTIIGSYDAEERGGIRISRGVRLLSVMGNTIKNTLGSGISIYPGNVLGTGESRGITVIGNILENCLADSSTSGAMVIGAAGAGVADLFDVVVRGNVIRDTRTGGLQAALGIRIINETSAMLQTWDIGANSISGPTAQITAISTWAAMNSLLTAKATLNFDLTAVASQDLTISVPGAVSGAPVLLGTPNGAVTAATLFWAWVSATDTVTVRAMRLSGTPDPASGTFTVTVAKMLA